jgi:cytoskeletal protein CcmA (bactofilin family)
MSTSSPAGRRSPPGPAERRTTVVSAGSTFRGDLVSSDPVEVHGTVEGDCQVSARFTVAEGARIFGNIDAATLVVSGEVVAGMLTAERIEIRPTAHVSATLRARVVAIAEGAVFEGDVDSREAPGGPAAEGR